MLERQNLRRGLERVVDWALIVAVFFVIGGAPVPDVNETHYWTKAKRFWDDAFCRGDQFLDSADVHIVYFGTFGALTQWTSLETAAWIGRLTAWSFLAWGWLTLVRSMVPWTLAPAFAAALMTTSIDWGNFSGEWVVGGAEGKVFAYAFVWLGLASCVQGKWNRGWCWFGFASSWHVLVGGWSTLAALGAWATEPHKTRPSLRSMAFGLLAGAALSLAGLIPAWRLESGIGSPGVADAAQIYVFERLPHHLAPLSLRTAELTRRSVRFGCLAGIWALLWVVSVRSARARVGPLGRGQVGLEHRESIEAADSLAESRLGRLFRFSAFALVFVVGGLLLEASLAQRPEAAASWLRYYWFRLADVAVPTVVAIASVCWMRTAIVAGTRGGQVAVSLALLASGWHLTTIAAERWHRPWPPADRRTLDVAAWRDACRWINDNAPLDASFFIPRDHQSFKWYAFRSDVCNWKDVPQDALAMTAWYARCRDLYRPARQGTSRRMVNWPSDLSAERIRDLASQYGFHYVVTANEPSLHLARVYQNSHYSIYWVGGPYKSEKHP